MNIFEFYRGGSWTLNSGFRRNLNKFLYRFCGSIVQMICFSHFQISCLFLVYTLSFRVLIYQEIFNAKFHVQTNMFLTVDGSGNETRFSFLKYKPKRNKYRG